MGTELEERDGKQVTFNQSGRKQAVTGSFWGCHEGGKHALWQAGYLLSSFPWQRVGVPEGNCARLWVWGVCK